MRNCFVLFSYAYTSLSLAAALGYFYERPAIPFHLPTIVSTATKAHPTVYNTQTRNDIYPSIMAEVTRAAAVAERVDNFAHQELGSEHKPRRQGHIHRLKPGGAVHAAKQQKHFGGYFYCNNTNYADYLLLRSQMRPADRRLTPYTEVVVGSAHFEPTAEEWSAMQTFVATAHTQ